MQICIDFYCFPGCFLCELRVSVVKTHFNQNWRKSSPKSELTGQILADTCLTRIP
jgi:hypothetical protein